ncbi:exopolysaccharide biosynthesis protein [Synechocystis sp. LKSZ1]|uniref:exopolysaccharide biosynthesis protein n=1 Tax=Synechocystis sp. LKSZ1 TaxID=3144951 RepID=UPI00336BC9A2
MNFKFSQDIEALLTLVAQKSLTLKDILNVTAERGFCLLIAFLALPFIFPIPPGLTGVAGVVILLLSGQMLLGFHRPWLPAQMARASFPTALAQHLLKHIKRLTKILERVTRPRLMVLATHPYIWRLNGLVLAWLTVLLILPIPLTNPFPAIGILLLTVAMLEADGLLMCFAYGWTFSITLGIYLLGAKLWSLAF